MGNPEDHSYWMERGIYPASRTILLHGEVNAQMSKQVLDAVEIFDRAGTTITVRINSRGGVMYDALAIYDCLRACRARVRTVGMGRVFSMGALILQAADEGRRILTPNASLMLHHGSLGIATKEIPETRVTLEEGERIRNRAWGIVAARMQCSLGDWLTRYDRDIFMSAETAVLVGLADRIEG